MSNYLRTGSRAAMAAVVLLVAACNSPGSSGGDAAADARQDALTSRGAEVYRESCASCHGDDLRGTDKGPSHLSIVYEPSHHPDASFRSAIANGTPQHHWGFGDMPPIEGLSDADVEAVIGFVRAEQTRLGFEP